MSIVSYYFLIVIIFSFVGCEAKPQKKESKQRYIKVFPKSSLGLWKLDEKHFVTIFNFCNATKFSAIKTNKDTGGKDHYTLKLERFVQLKNQPDKNDFGILVMEVTERRTKQIFELTFDVRSGGELAYEENSGPNYLQRRKCPSK